MYHGSFILPVGFKAPFGLGILAIVLHLFNRPLHWLQILGLKCTRDFEIKFPVRLQVRSLVVILPFLGNSEIDIQGL